MSARVPRSSVFSQYFTIHATTFKLHQDILCDEPASVDPLITSHLKHRVMLRVRRLRRTDSQRRRRSDCVCVSDPNVEESRQTDAKMACSFSHLFVFACGLCVRRGVGCYGSSASYHLQLNFQVLMSVARRPSVRSGLGGLGWCPADSRDLTQGVIHYGRSSISVISATRRNKRTVSGHT